MRFSVFLFLILANSAFAFDKQFADYKMQRNHKYKLVQASYERCSNEAKEEQEGKINVDILGNHLGFDKPKPSLKSKVNETVK